MEDKETSFLYDFSVFLLGLIILLVLIAINWWVFSKFFEVDYFLWYLEAGILINLGASFLALFWGELDARKDLLSAHPLKFISGIFILNAVFSESLADFLDNPIHGKEELDSKILRKALFFLWDSAIGLVLIICIFVIVLAWSFVIAPLNYFVYLISGTLARQSFRGLFYRSIVIQNGKETIITKQPVGENLPKNAVDTSLLRKPFVMTNALTSLVLFIIKFALGVE